MISKLSDSYSDHGLALKSFATRSMNISTYFFFMDIDETKKKV